MYHVYFFRSAPEDKVTVVCYCSVGYRSSIVAQKIAEYINNKGDYLSFTY